MDLYKRPEEAFEGTPHSDISIIIPPFGRTSAHQEIVLPNDVDIPQLAGRKHIEDSWLLWGIASTKTNGLVLAVTSEGMLNSASRQPIREYVVAQGLQTVILLGATFAESVINTALGKLLLNNVRYFPRTDKAPDKAGFAESDDILVTTAGSLGKCCIVPESLADGVYFDTSIRRLRVDTEVAEIASVYSFLRTEAAQLQIERYASGSVIPNISSANLGSIRIFLPEDSSDPTTPSSATSITQSIAQTLLDKVVYPLQKADADDDGWRDQVLEVLNNTIHVIQRNRRSLHDLVTQSYPLPIALAYRRMTRASHNPYEQRSRLIELYEALTHFFYCVLICDYLSNSELQSKPLPAAAPPPLSLLPSAFSISPPHTYPFIMSSHSLTDHDFLAASKS